MNNTIRKEIIRKHHTPLYLLDIEAFSGNYRELEEAYKKRYSNFRIAYSFKTNYTPVICNIVRKAGGYAEVVSELEYHMAKRYGFEGGNIIVNGPGKMNGIPEMVSDGALIMLDNAYELDEVIRAAATMDRQAKVGFRLNFEIGSGKDSRFGFDILSEETRQQIQRARENNKTRIKGIHFHLSGARSLDAWRTRAEKMIQYADELLLMEEQEIIDLGSGMFGHLAPQLAVQFPEEIPTFEDYSEAVAGVFAREYKNRSNPPQLVVEPGTTIVANTMEYITRVIAVKVIRDRRIAVVDGSVHQLGEMGKKKNLPISVLREEDTTGQMLKDAEITGYTCLEDDILYRGCPEEIGIGDYVVFGNAGAYSNVLKPPFIQQGCKMICYDSLKGSRLCKREETIDDILSSYLL